MERRTERDRVRDELLAGAEEGEPRWLLAHLLEYHRREEKPQWWEYFHHRGLDEEELLDDGDTIGGLELAGEPVPVARSLEYTFTLRRAGAQDRHARPSTRPPSASTRVRVDDEHGTVTLRRGLELADEPLPRALIPPQPLPTWTQRDAVLRFAQRRDEFPALVEILERRPPRARLDGSPVEAALSLDGSYLFVQGPPGSGKTWNGARMAVALMQAERRVGVTALSHKAIHRFLEEVEDAAREAGFAFRGLKKASGEESRFEGEFVESTESNADMLDPELELLAGTSFLFAREDMEAPWTRSSSTRAASSRSPTRSRSAAPRATSSSSATRTSSRRSPRARTRRARAPRCSAISSARTRRCGRAWASSWRRRGGCGRR